MTVTGVSMAWGEVLAASLVGTDRRAGQEPAAVLDAAAGWGAARRAGYRAGAAPSSPADAEPGLASDERRELVGAASARHLAVLIDVGLGGPLDSATREAVLEEWLRAVQGHGRRVPPELLPALLDHARRRVDLRPLVAAVGGARAHWLAVQNPEWTFLTREADESGSVEPALWDTGSRAQRVAHLSRLRAAQPADAGPAAAGELLAAQWSSLPGDERAELLATLATGLGPADEALLERALDDRRREVRGIAERLLASLPGSEYNARAAARARACLELTPDAVVVTPPAECDRGMRRDGVTPRPPSGTGERAWWLEEVLARAPLDTWTGPAALLARTGESEFATTLHHGLSRAAALRRDPLWAAALLDVLGDAPRDRECAAALYPVLDPAEVVRRASAALARPGAAATWGPLLGHLPAPWPSDLATPLLGGLVELAKEPRLGGDLYQLCRLAAVRLPVAAVPMVWSVVGRVLEAGQAGLRLGPLEHLTDVLKFRYEMTLEIGRSK